MAPFHPGRVDDFLAAAAPEGKLSMIRDFQTKSRLAAITGGGTSDAPGLAALNVMGLHSPQSAVLSAIIYNALIIIAPIPPALKGVKCRGMPALLVQLLNVPRNHVLFPVIFDQ